MRARDAMLPTPLVILPAMSLLEFIDAVLNTNQTTACVVQDGALLGVVSVKDIFRRIVPPYLDERSRLAEMIHASYFEEEFEKFKHTTVGDIMTTEIETAAPDDPIILLVSMFVQKGRKTIPVVEAGRYVGSVTRRSVLWTVTRRARG